MGVGVGEGLGGWVGEEATGECVCIHECSEVKA